MSRQRVRGTAGTRRTTPRSRDPVHRLAGVGPVRAALLEKIGVRAVVDLLGLLPRRYDDRRFGTDIARLKAGRSATFAARVLSAGPELTPVRRRRLFRAVFEDDSGTIPATWFRFRPGHLGSLLTPGAAVIVHGRPAGEPHRLELLHPEVEKAEEACVSPGLRPVYPATDGLPQSALRRIVRGALAAALPGMRDPLPADLRARHGLPDIVSALTALHDPEPDAALDDLAAGTSRWHRRLAFGELFALQIALALRRRRYSRAKPLRSGPVPPEGLERFRGRLPFELTSAQTRVCGEIEHDLGARRPMQRLLQGDVGSGKTILAAFAAAATLARGGQVALLAPTELLAEQHARTFEGLSDAVGTAAELLTGSTPRVRRTAVIDGLARGKVRFVVGTHALLAEHVRFRKLALALIDEQHRFGVRQRVGLGAKGEAPDLLVMTATPIPRSLALALYGDLDVSVLDELPPGRQPVATQVLGEGDRPQVRRAVRETLALGQRVLVVCPLAEEGGDDDPPTAARTAARVRRELPGTNVALLHGRLGHGDRSRALARFRSGEAPVLVATTIVEVGLDVPEAGLVVVEGAERFGLSQLHQIRGRVGRGAGSGQCILVAGDVIQVPALERLAVLARTGDGFAVAEEDLRLRGPGYLLGSRQSGAPDLRFADLGRDLTLLSAAREEARRLLAKDPDLSLPEHAGLLRAAERAWDAAGAGAPGGRQAEG